MTRQCPDALHKLQTERKKFMIQILTQDHCPRCTGLKLYIEKGLGAAYAGQLEYVHRNEQPERFAELAGRHRILSTPAVIAGEDVLREPSAGNLKPFLDAHCSRT